MALLAGLLILVVGAFVLAAKPASWLHRLFFLLAVADGASTAFFRLLLMAEDRALQATLLAGYWAGFLAFVALLGVFGVLFPRPPRSRVLAYGLVGTFLGGGAGLTLMYLLDPRAFWLWAPAGSAYPVTVQPFGNLLNVGFVAASGLILVRLARSAASGASDSHRRQAAYVLGGMALAYVPYPVTSLVQALASDPSRAFVTGRLDGVLAYWVFALATAAYVGTGVLLLRRRDPRLAAERRFVLGCYAGVLGMAALVLVLPTSAFATMVRAAGLVAYPILLGFAIVRYEVFDIDRKLRRAATVSLAAIALTGVFVVAENAVETMLQDAVLAGVPSPFLSGSVAAIATGAFFVPVLKISRRLSGRVIPELTMDELHLRKLEIYRHSVAGAYADGILREGESRTLKALRESLGITPREHEEILATVQPA